MATPYETLPTTYDNGKKILDNREARLMLLFYCYGLTRSGSIVGEIHEFDRMLFHFDKMCLDLVNCSTTARKNTKETINKSLALLVSEGLAYSGDKILGTTNRDGDWVTILHPKLEKNFMMVSLRALNLLFAPVGKNAATNGNPYYLYTLPENVKVSKNVQTFNYIANDGKTSIMRWGDMEGLFSIYLYITYYLNLKMDKGAKPYLREGYASISGMKKLLGMGAERVEKNLQHLLRMGIFSREKFHKDDGTFGYIWRELI